MNHTLPSHMYVQITFQFVYSSCIHDHTFANVLYIYFIFILLLYFSPHTSIHFSCLILYHIPCSHPQFPFALFSWPLRRILWGQRGHRCIGSGLRRGGGKLSRDRRWRGQYRLLPLSYIVFPIHLPLSPIRSATCGDLKLLL